MGPEIEGFVEDSVGLGKGGYLVHDEGGRYVSYEGNDNPLDMLDRMCRHTALYSASSPITRQPGTPLPHTQIKLEFIRYVAVVGVVPGLGKEGGRSGGACSSRGRAGTGAGT